MEELELVVKDKIIKLYDFLNDEKNREEIAKNNYKIDKIARKFQLKKVEVQAYLKNVCQISSSEKNKKICEFVANLQEHLIITKNQEIEFDERMNLINLSFGDYVDEKLDEPTPAPTETIEEPKEVITEDSNSLYEYEAKYGLHEEELKRLIEEEKAKIDKEASTKKTNLDGIFKKRKKKTDIEQDKREQDIINVLNNEEEEESLYEDEPIKKSKKSGLSKKEKIILIAIGVIGIFVLYKAYTIFTKPKHRVNIQRNVEQTVKTPVPKYEPEIQVQPQQKIKVPIASTPVPTLPNENRAIPSPIPTVNKKLSMVKEESKEVSKVVVKAEKKVEKIAEAKKESTPKVTIKEQKNTEILKDSYSIKEFEKLLNSGEIIIKSKSFKFRNKTYKRNSMFFNLKIKRIGKDYIKILDTKTLFVSRVQKTN